jgi:hypothetical protein
MYCVLMANILLWCCDCFQKNITSMSMRGSRSRGSLTSSHGSRLTSSTTRHANFPPFANDLTDPRLHVNRENGGFYRSAPSLQLAGSTDGNARLLALDAKLERVREMRARAESRRSDQGSLAQQGLAPTKHSGTGSHDGAKGAATATTTVRARREPLNRERWLSRYQRNREAEYVQKHVPALRAICASVKVKPNLAAYEDVYRGATALKSGGTLWRSWSRDTLRSGELEVPGHRRAPVRSTHRHPPGISASRSEPSLLGGKDGGGARKWASRSEMMEARKNDARMEGAQATGNAEALAQAEFKAAEFQALRQRLRSSTFVRQASDAMNSRFTDMFKAFQYVDLDRSGKLNESELRRALDLWNVPIEAEKLAELITACDGAPSLPRSHLLPMRVHRFAFVTDKRTL